MSRAEEVPRFYRREGTTVFVKSVAARCLEEGARFQEGELQGTRPRTESPAHFSVFPEGQVRWSKSCDKNPLSKNPRPRSTAKMADIFRVPYPGQRPSSCFRCLLQMVVGQRPSHLMKAALLLVGLALVDAWIGPALINNQGAHFMLNCWFHAVLLLKTRQRNILRTRVLQVSALSGRRIAR